MDAAQDQPTRLEFTEEMKGFVTLGEQDPQRGFDRGRAESTALMFHLTIAVEDMDRFLVDPDRAGSAVGWVECEALGGRLPVERGVFNLFVPGTADGADARRSRMLYRLHFSDGDGRPLTLTGVKDVHDDPGLDVWRDTSTLAVRLLQGHVEPPDDDSATVVGAGIIRIHVTDFVEQLTTFRTRGPDLSSRARALESFARVFLGELWTTYGERVLHPVGSGGDGRSAASAGPERSEAQRRPGARELGVSAPLRQLRTGLARLVPLQRQAARPAAEPPHGPSPDDPATSFDRKPATRWLEPRLLLRSAVQVLVSSVLGAYQDKREQIGSIPAAGHLDLSDRDEAWIDYVSDTGDGFDATYAIASLVARPQLDLDDAGALRRTQRGRLLVLGGDQVYPAADVEEYEDRLIGPYRAALPQVLPEADAPHVQAVPGNHDWYDGLTSFMRTFCQQKWIGGWRSRQARSYFATKLPAGWWLWGIDIQFDTYVDDAQLTYFAEIGKRMEPGSAIILCTAKPSWVAAVDEDVEAYAALDYFVRKTVPDGVHVRVALSGDRHHYARYESADGSQRITSGGGGAYLSATHHLPQHLCIPPVASRARGKSAPTPYERAEAMWPDEATSRRLALGVLRLPWLTPTLGALLGGVQALLGLAVGAALAPPARGVGDSLTAWAAGLRDAGTSEVAAGLAGSFTALGLSGLVVAGAVSFARPGKQLGLSSGVTRAVGVLHGLLHLGLAVGVTAAAAALTRGLPGAWLLVGFVPVVVVAGGALGAELVALYLLAADRVGRNTNELFAAQGRPQYKQFLRLHVDADGALQIYPIGLVDVPRRWEDVPDPSSSARIRPADGELAPVLVEGPVTVTRAPASPDASDDLAAAGADRP